MRCVVLTLAVLVAAAAQGQGSSHPVPGGVSRTEHFADFASLPACDASNTFMQDRHVDDVDARYMCYDFGAGLAWTLIGSDVTLPFVPVTGTNTTDIQDALDTLTAAGATVLLSDVAYSPCASPIVIPFDNVTLMGSQAVIDCSAGQPLPAVIDLAGHDFLTLSGFEIVGDAGGGANSDLVASSSTVTDSRFENLTLTESDRDGFRLPGAAQRNKFLGNTISLSDGNGLQCVSGGDFLIEGNTFSGNVTKGIDGRLMTESTLSKNRFSGTYSAVQVTGSGNSITANNLEFGFIEVSGTGQTVEGNRITVRESANSDGIRASTALTNSSILHNRILGNPAVQQQGIELITSSGNNVSHNNLTHLSTGATNGAIRLDVSSGSNQLIGNLSIGSDVFLDNESASPQAVIMTAAGNVGIGIESPGFSLEAIAALAVSSAEGAGGDLLRVGDTSAPATVVITGEVVGDVLQVVPDDGGAIALEISNAGIVAHPRNIGANPPATCTPGTIFTDLDAADDTNCITALDNSICLCISANTWVERS